MIKTIALALCVVSAPAFSQASSQPPIGPAPDFQLPATTSFSLENGIDVTFIDFGLAPKVNISVRVMAGNAFDGETTYMADLVGDMLEEGSAGESPADIARAFASMGGDMNVGVGMHVVNFSANVLSEFGGDAVTRLATVIRQPDFPDSEFDRVLQNQIRNMTVARSQPGPIATEAYVGLLYGTDHPYGAGIPDVGEMDSYTLNQVREFYEANYGAARTRIYVAGRFDHDQMEAAIRNAFSDWETGNEAELVEPTVNDGPVVRLIDRPGAPQATIRIGFAAPQIGTEDAYAMTVMNALLGGSFTSRLTTNLRETNGWTYSPNSGVTNRMGSAYWTFNADIVTEHLVEAFSEIINEVQTLQIEVPEEEEANGMRTWISGIFILQNASTGGLIAQLANRDLYGLPEDYLESYVSNINAVSNADISRMATEYLTLDEMVLVVVGDLASIEDELLAYPQLADATIIRDERE